MLIQDEKLIWRERPGFIKYLLGHGELWFGIGFNILFVSGWFAMEMLNPDRLISWKLYLLFIPIFLILLLLFLFKCIQYRNVEFGLSKRRIFVSRGLFFKTVDSFDLKQVKRVQVNVNLAQAILQVGSIRFFTGRVSTGFPGITSEHYECWESISNPGVVLRQIEEIRLMS